MLVLVGFSFAEAQLIRPTPMGVDGGNAVINYTATRCYGFPGTLGAVVADQNGNQYVLSDSHVLAVGATSFLASGSSEPITQPDVITDLASNCNLINPTQIASIEVATLSTVVPVNFNGKATSAADAAIAQVLPGMVSPAIVGISVFSGVQLQVEKKGLQLQKTGTYSGNTIGHVEKINVTAIEKFCQHVSTDGTEKTCGLTDVRIPGAIEIKPGNFAGSGDSGALVLTVGPCPQPEGIVISGNSTHVLVEAIGPTMTALMSAGGYSSLSVVPGGAGCSPTTAQVQDFGDSNPADFTVADPNVPDSDVAQALAVLPNLANEGCAGLDSIYGDIAGVAVDLSVSPAALDVIVNNASDLDPNNYCIPASFGGVPVEQSVVETFDNQSDTTVLTSGSN